MNAAIAGKAAATVPEGIYEEDDGSFELTCTASRLVEMQSEAYLGGQ